MERRGPAKSPLADVTSESDGRSIMRREGEYWTIAHAGRLTRLRHSKGLDYLDRMLREPGRDFAALELAGAHGPSRRETRRVEEAAGLLAAERGRVAVTRAIRNALGRLSIHDPVLGELLGKAVRTGARCRYVPGPGLPVAWER